MTIWIIAFVLFGVFGLVGYFLGAIRSAVVFLGVLLGGLLALPLGPTLKPLLPPLGVTNLVWLWLLPPVVFFILLGLIALGAGFAVHYPIAKKLRFKTDDVGYAQFQRVNSRLGVCVSLVSAVICLFLVAIGLYGPGYLAVQFAHEESDPGWLKFVTNARIDMQSTGLDRFAASFDPMPKKYYPAVDVLAIVYHNLPGIHRRLADYPPFLTLGERQEFTDMSGDKEFMESISGKAGVVELMNNNRVLGMIVNSEIVGELDKIDLNDFKNYLEKGKSAKYDSLKILGRWEMEPAPMVQAIRKSRLDITPTELEDVRRAANTIAAGTILKATTDNKFTLAMKGTLADLKKIVAPKSAVTTVAMSPAGAGVAPTAPPSRRSLGPMSGMSAELRQRYGLQAAPTAPPPGAAPQEPGEPNADGQPPAPEPPKYEAKTLQGSWEGDGETYQFSLRDDSGKETTCDASVDGDMLTFVALGQTFIFYRL